MVVTITEINSHDDGVITLGLWCLCSIKNGCWVVGARAHARLLSILIVILALILILLLLM